MSSLCLLAFAALTVIAGVDGPPVTKNLDEGDTVNLRCHTNKPSPVLWLQRQSTDTMSSVLTIVDGSVLRVVDRFKDEMSLNISGNGDYDLTIHNLQQRHSAQYLCQDNNGFGPGETIYRLNIQRQVRRLDHLNHGDGQATSGSDVVPTEGTIAVTVSKLGTTTYAVIGVTCAFGIIASISCGVLTFVILTLKRRKRNVMSRACCDEKSQLLGNGGLREPTGSDFVFKPPIELLELLLLKATLLLFHETKKSATQTEAAVDSMRVMWSVSNSWFRTMVDRNWMKRQTRRAIEYDCRPFCFKPLKVHCIETLDTSAGNHDVWGLTQLHDKIYIAWWMSETVGAFSAEPPFQHLSDWDIVVKHLTVPVGLDGCEVGDCLYLGDADNRCVWKFDIDTVKAAHLDDRWFTLDENDPKGSRESMWLRVNEPFERLLSLKVIDAQNIVVLVVEDRPDGGLLWKGRLVVLSSDSTVKHNITLPESIQNPWHAIPSLHTNSFIVVHGPVYGSKPHGIAEVSVDGKTTESSLEGISLNVPINVTRCTDKGDMFIADECNARILLIDKHLKPKSVFMQWCCSADKQDNDPTRVTVDHRRQRILVGLRGGNVEVFSFKDKRKPAATSMSAQNTYDFTPVESLAPAFFETRSHVAK